MKLNFLLSILIIACFLQLTNSSSSIDEDDYVNENDYKSKNVNSNEADDEVSDGDDDSSLATNDDVDGDESGDGCSASYVIDHIFLEEDQNVDNKNLQIKYEIENEATNTANEKDQLSSLTSEFRYYRMTNFTSNLQVKFTPFAKELASLLSDLLYEAQLEPVCIGALLKLTSGIAHRKPWALSCT